MKNKKTALTAILVFALCAALLMGCASGQTASVQPREDEYDDATVAATVAATVPVTPAVSISTRCSVCGEYDCDDGIYCDDWDEKTENLREEEYRENGTPCNVCGDYDCDDGVYCNNRDDRHDDDHDYHNGHHDD